MPKVQTHYLSTSGLKDRNVRHLSCEGCRKRKMKCSRTMPCVACELRGLDCVWLDCKPAHGLMQASLEENQAEIIRLEKVIRQLQALLIERDGRPYPLPPAVAPLTPPYDLDDFPLPSPHEAPRAPHFYEVPAHQASYGTAPSMNLPWLSSTRGVYGHSPTSRHPAYSTHGPPPTHGVEYRPSYDATVSYAPLLPTAPAPLHRMQTSPATTPVWSTPHSRSATWPSSAPAYSDHPGDTLFLPASSSSPVESETSFRPAPSDLPPLNTSVVGVQGQSAVSALLNGVYAQVSRAEAEALGLHFDGVDVDVDEGARAERAEWESLVTIPDEQV